MEIGSEYSWPEEWIVENKKEETGWKESFPYSDRQMVFSGRTALEYILKEIGNVKKAVLPSYCCESMIQPFLHAGIQVSFYSVEFVNGTLNILLEIEKDVDVVFWCNYFGFFHEFPEEIINVFQSRGGIVIEDITHSFLSEKQVHTLSDYFFVSLRKWGPMVCGGVAYKRKGKFSNHPLSMPDDWFLEMKKDAMKRKASYLSRERNQSEKAIFLNEFGKTNDYFDQFYRGKGIDEASKMLFSVWCHPGTFVRRRENAETIYEILTETKGLYFLFPRQAADCPLFIPIIINHNQRNQLKKRLAEKQIYCPNHWPKPSVKGADSNLYNQELSLICDQRYTKKEIETMAKAVKEEFEILNLTKSNRGGYFEGLVLIISQLHKIEAGREDLEYGRKRYEELCRYIDSGKAICRVLIANQMLCGYVWFFRRKDGRIHINEFAVEESQRGKGFGKILIKEVYEYAKKAECMEVELFVMENNEEAIKFYEKQGFKTERKWMVKTLEG